jgi:hypothetical protein
MQFSPPRRLSSVRMMYHGDRSVLSPAASGPSPRILVPSPAEFGEPPLPQRIVDPHPKRRSCSSIPTSPELDQDDAALDGVLLRLGTERKEPLVLGRRAETHHEFHATYALLTDRRPELARNGLRGPLGLCPCRSGRDGPTVIAMMLVGGMKDYAPSFIVDNRSGAGGRLALGCERRPGRWLGYDPGTGLQPHGVPACLQDAGLRRV